MDRHGEERGFNTNKANGTIVEAIVLGSHKNPRTITTTPSRRMVKPESNGDVPRVMVAEIEAQRGYMVVGYTEAMGHGLIPDELVVRPINGVYWTDADPPMKALSRDQCQHMGPVITAVAADLLACIVRYAGVSTLSIES